MNNLNFENQLKYHLKALEIRKNIFFDVDHPDVARSLLNVALAFDKANDSENRIKYSLKAVEMFERLFKGETPNLDLANSYSFLGYFKINLLFYLKRLFNI
jgi:hypothetical protein